MDVKMSRLWKTTLFVIIGATFVGVLIVPLQNKYMTSNYRKYRDVHLDHIRREGLYSDSVRHSIANKERQRELDNIRAIQQNGIKHRRALSTTLPPHIKKMLEAQKRNVVVPSSNNNVVISSTTAAPSVERATTTRSSEQKPELSFTTKGIIKAEYTNLEGQKGSVIITEGSLQKTYPTIIKSPLKQIVPNALLSTNSIISTRNTAPGQQVNNPLVTNGNLDKAPGQQENNPLVTNGNLNKPPGQQESNGFLPNRTMNTVPNVQRNNEFLYNRNINTTLKVQKSIPPLFDRNRITAPNRHENKTLLSNWNLNTAFDQQENKPVLSNRNIQTTPNVQEKKPFPPSMEMNPSSNDRENYNIKPKKVLIYGKYRTGSSFTGKFLAKRKDTYYSYEPLQMLKKENWYEDSKIVSYIRNALDCQFKELWNEGMSNPLHTNNSLPGWKGQIFCFQFPDPVECTWLPIERVEKICEGFKHRASKVIQARSLQSLEPLLSERVHVVHLVRDPRAVFSSQLSTMFQNYSEIMQFLENSAHYLTFMNEAFSYCHTLRLDLNYIRDYKSRHPDVLYTIVRYEDLALHPGQGLQALNTYLDLAPDAEASKWANSLEKLAYDKSAWSEILSMDTKSNTFKPDRRNSSGTALMWKDKASLEVFQDIETMCQDVMNLLNYTNIRSEAARTTPHAIFLKPFNYQRFPLEYKLGYLNMNLNKLVGVSRRRTKP